MAVFSEPASKFLFEHTVGVLSTVDTKGNVHGAVIYYIAESETSIYFVSKSLTTKVKDIQQHRNVALTIYYAPMAQTLQITGIAHQETDKKTVDYVFDNIVKLRLYGGKMLMPPVTVLKDSGEYVVMRITPTKSKFSDYQQQLTPYA
jgi:general stress protein 26